jgi:hypothetical protein
MRVNRIKRRPIQISVRRRNNKIREISKKVKTGGN